MGGRSQMRCVSKRSEARESGTCFETGALFFRERVPKMQESRWERGGTSNRALFFGCCRHNRLGFRDFTFASLRHLN